MVHLQPFQTGVHRAHESVIGARPNFTSQPQSFAAARFQDLPDARLAFAVPAIAVRRIDIGNPEIERVVQHLDALVLVVLNKPAAAAKRQDGHVGSRAAQRPHRHPSRPDQRSGRRAQRRRAQEFPP